MNVRIMLLGIAALSGLAASPSLAQRTDTSPENAAGLFDRLLACRNVSGTAERLDCFDRTAVQLDEARIRKDVVVMDRAEMRKARRTLFGFPLPRIRLFGDGDDDERGGEPDIKEITSTVKSYNEAGFRKWVFALEDGSHWQTTEVVANFVPRAGEPIRVTRSPLGGYFLHVGGGGLRIRARRIE